MGDYFSDISLIYLKPRISDRYALSITAVFKRVLGLVIHHNDLLVGELDPLDRIEKNIIRTWNPADPFVAQQRFCMHHLVEAKTRECPNTEAVCAWDGTLTYAELNALSDKFAYQLRKLGVRAGVNVPFAFEKSMWVVVAMLAILKSGGAFVPLNPQDPPTRLAEILKNVEASVVATSNTYLPSFVDLVKHVVVISTQSVKESLANNLTANSYDTQEIIPAVEASVTPDDPILVLSTSGSTGKPKGMVHTHASICTHALTHGEAMSYHQARVFQFAAYTFDVAVMDVFTTLLFGGCICIPSEESRRSDIIGVINTMQADHAILTPSVAGLIDPSEVPTLKTLGIGGEALPQDRIERWADKVRLIQIYGPAEVGICLVKHLARDTRPENVGYPLLNSSCWLVDPDNSDRLVPIGAVGELLIAGPSVAQGYVGDELKTQAAFIDPPLWAKTLDLPYQCFYKSGDLLRYNVEDFDGSFFFIGRKDAQIKLRGQRIEPGEIEYHIGRLPAVVNSLVTQPKEGAFKEELVAVVQLESLSGERTCLQNEPIRLAAIQALTVQTVKERLVKILPTYMVPTICLTVENMPFVPSLKIDRRVVNSWLARMESRPEYTTWKPLMRLHNDEVTAIKLSRQVAEILKSTRNGDVSLFEHNDFILQETGINSIQIISFSMYLQKNHQKIPMNILLDPQTTIRHLADFIDKHHSLATNSHPSVLEISKSAPLPDCFQDARSLNSSLLSSISLSEPIPVQCIKPPSTHNILVTGATGYLGLAILNHLLLASASSHIYTLIRCSSPAVGLSKLISAAKVSGWWLEEYSSRIHVWPGDLEVPLLGLGQRELALVEGSDFANGERIHVIIHNGAKVHYSTSYAALRSVNVLSTFEMLKLAAKSRSVSRFVFVSGGESPALKNSSTTLSHKNLLSNASGYTQSKYVCEKLIYSCTSQPLFRGKALSIVKPGYIIGAAATGLANRKDFIWRVIASCVELGVYNKNELQHWLYISSIDCVAGHVIRCVYPSSAEKMEEGREIVERVLSGFYFRDLWALVEDFFGTRLEALDATVWIRRLKQRVLEVGEKHLLFPLLDVLERDGCSIGDPGVCCAENVNPQASEHALEDTVAVVRRNLEYLVSIGFFPSVREDSERMDSIARV